MGYFFERVWRAFSFIWAAVKMAFRDKDLFIPSLLSLVANVGYAVVIVVVLGATGTLWLAGLEKSDIEELREAAALVSEGPGALAEAGREEALAGGEAPEGALPEDAIAATREERPEEETRTRRYLQAAFGVVVLFGAMLITYFFSAMTVSLVYDHLSGKDARVGEAFSVVMARLPGIVLLAVVSTAVSVVARLARGKRGSENLVGGILGGIIERLWTVASFLILPGMVIHKLSLIQALKRAKEIAVGNLLVVAVGEIAVTMVANFIIFIGVVGGFVSGVFVYRFVPDPFLVPLGAGGVVVVLAIAFTTYVKMAYYTCLYLNATESAQAGRRVAAKGPLAEALA